jgi:rhodanese-related sulfurtransferase
MKKSAVLLVLLAIWSCSRPGAGNNESLLTPQAFAEKMKSGGDYVLLDVRSSQEVQTAVLDGSVNIDFNSPNFDRSLDSLDHSKKYLVYCASGIRSGRALKMMKAKGFHDVAALEGGLRAWEAAGLPIQKN